MPSLKEVKNRINSVTSTQKITKAMKMVSAAKLRRAQDRIIQMRPYAEKLSSILDSVSSATSSEKQNPYAEVREVKSVLIVVVTSDRALCGAFNSNVNKKVIALVNEKYAQQLAAGMVEFLCVGSKGFEYFRKRGYKVIGEYVTLFQGLSFDKARAASEFAMNGFLSKKYDAVELVYNEFKNVATQILTAEQFLPLGTKTYKKITLTKKEELDYIFEPSKEEIVDELIPKSLKVHFYRALLESNASEHGARMTAMDKATDNAGELLKQLKLTYNRTRQAAITKEILEIVGGAEALAQA